MHPQCRLFADRNVGREPVERGTRREPDELGGGGLA